MKLIIGLPDLGDESPSTFASNSKITLKRLIDAKMVIPEYYNDDDCCPVEIYSEAIANFQTLVDEYNQIETHDIDTVLVNNLENIAIFHENEDTLVFAITKMLLGVFETMKSHKRKYTITAAPKSVIVSPGKTSVSTAVPALKKLKIPRENVQNHKNPDIIIAEENEEQYPPEVFFEVKKRRQSTSTDPLTQVLSYYVKESREYLLNLNKDNYEKDKSNPALLLVVEGTIFSVYGCVTQLTRKVVSADSVKFESAKIVCSRCLYNFDFASKNWYDVTHIKNCRSFLLSIYTTCIKLTEERKAMQNQSIISGYFPLKLLSNPKFEATATSRISKKLVYRNGGKIWKFCESY